ncbi:MAG TPA: hypothetical protein VHW06_12045 [Streptosporangiaceae bacterium]|nr:hypothetical protein [Streptosporangiaceae bacterium]
MASEQVLAVEQFSSLVAQAQGPAGLTRFLELELDNALALDPQAQDKGRLTRLIAGNPVIIHPHP